MSQVQILSGDTVTIVSEASDYDGNYAVAQNSTSTCTQNCNPWGTASPTKNIDICMTTQALAPSATISSGFQFKIYALSYNSVQGSFTTLPQGTPITIGSYIGFSTLSPVKYLQTGPNSFNTLSNNNIIQIQNSSWTVSDGSQGYRVWVFVGPAANLTNQAAACPNGYLNNKNSFANGTNALSSNTNCNPNTPLTPIYYGQTYYLQSVGYMGYKSQSQYWALGNEGGYSSCGSAIYTYHLQNGQLPTGDFSTYSFRIQAANGATAPGGCFPPCPTPSVCAPSGSGCYTPGVCPTPCNTAAGWICGSNNVCITGATPVCSSPCGPGQTCAFTNNGQQGGVGATCVVNDGCGGSCPSGQECKSGKCVTPQQRSWGFWALIILVVVLVLASIAAIVVFVVVLLAKKSKSGPPPSAAKAPATKAPATKAPAAKAPAPRTQ